MSSSDHTGTIADRALGVIDNLKPLKKQKSPVLAAILGFFCGGIGLGIYFESWLDFFVPIAIWIVIALVAIPTAEALDVLGFIFCCFYGYRRATTSNAKLDALNAHPPVIELETVPPRFQATSTSPPLPQESMGARQRDVEQRLEKLKDLLGKQMISQAEYEAKRKQVLDEI